MDNCRKCVDAAGWAKPTQFIECDDTCSQCKKKIERRLDLHHTSAILCSFECERKYWLDILF
jgi:hypothetical protein